MMVESVKRTLARATGQIYSLPIVVLMPHSGCNCRCVMCDIWRANVNRQELSRADLERHIDAFRRLGVRRVALSGGEALMHSNLWALCQILKELPVEISLLSTGLLLSRHAAEIVRWCDDAIVSLDGSAPIHNAIRNIPHAYERMAEGIRALRAIAPDFRVTGRSTIQRRNYHDLPGIIRAAHELGLNQISFLPVDVSSSAFNRPVPWGTERVADTALVPEEVNEFAGIVEQTIREYASDFTSGFVAENPDRMRRMVRYFAALNGEGDFPEIICNAPWVSAVIEADGAVRPCFFHRTLGNIHDAPLEDILNSKQAVAFRRHLDVHTDPICRKCVCTLYLGARQEVR